MNEMYLDTTVEILSVCEREEDREESERDQEETDSQELCNNEEKHITQMLNETACFNS